jgi:hypothetical protein
MKTRISLDYKPTLRRMGSSRLIRKGKHRKEKAGVGF